MEIPYLIRSQSEAACCTGRTDAGYRRKMFLLLQNCWSWTKVWLWWRDYGQTRITEPCPLHGGWKYTVLMATFSYDWFFWVTSLVKSSKISQANKLYMTSEITRSLFASGQPWPCLQTCTSLAHSAFTHRGWEETWQYNLVVSLCESPFRALIGDTTVDP